MNSTFITGVMCSGEIDLRVMVHFSRTRLIERSFNRVFSVVKENPFWYHYFIGNKENVLTKDNRPNKMQFA